ncbi:MAG TPA: hypothetical protein ENG26_00350 [Gammaproteobacteria bacterium]|nr:hypothetical protein [Gammaproteobacteria bacterium]
MDLQLPDRRKPTGSSFDTKPDVIKAWVNELPLINPGKSRALLDDALKQLNSLRLPTKNRLETLELLAASVMCVAEAMKKVFLAKPIPLKSNNLLLATQTVELCNQMATGYRILADDLGHNDRQTPRLTVAIHRSLRYLSEVLLTNYQLYIQYPEGLWKTINSLYALAEQHDITAQAITDTTLPTPSRSTISTVYKQILLLSLACPYRLRQKEIHFVYNALLNWADTSQLHYMDESRPHGLFAINLNTDNPPSYLALNEPATPNSHWRILDTTSMSDRIRDILDKQPDNANRYTGIGNTDILQRLMLAWGVMPKRRFARHSRSAKVGLVVGLNAIHHRVTEPETEINSKNETIEDQHYLQDPTFEAVTTVKTNRLADGGRRIVTSGNKQARELPVEHQAEIPNIEAWKMVNISAGGYCLLWDSVDPSSAQVGELVAIIEQDNLNGDAWHLGVVRWMKCSDKYGLELGTEMLSPSAQAVWAYLDEAGVRSRSKMQGILLPEIKALKQQASLLLPTLPFQAGCLATLQTADTLENIKLTRQLENTGSFAQYHFSAAVNA